jgi:hypothetical protein
VHGDLKRIARVFLWRADHCPDLPGGYTRKEYKTFYEAVRRHMGNLTFHKKRYQATYDKILSGFHPPTHIGSLAYSVKTTLSHERKFAGQSWDALILTKEAPPASFNPHIPDGKPTASGDNIPPLNQAPISHNTEQAKRTASGDNITPLNQAPISHNTEQAKHREEWQEKQWFIEAIKVLTHPAAQQAMDRLEYFHGGVTTQKSAVNGRFGTSGLNHLKNCDPLHSIWTSKYDGKQMPPSNISERRKFIAAAKHVYQHKDWVKCITGPDFLFEPNDIADWLEVPWFGEKL